MKSKFTDELSELVKNQVISEDVAFKIRSFYDSQRIDSSNKLFTVFGVLGSLLVGLGVILILAHNWDDFSRPVKTTLAFTPLLIGQVLMGYTILKEKSGPWREATGTFLFFGVGSSIALVSQIYNIPGDVSVYILTWVLLCLPLVYLLKSDAVAVLHIVFSTYYACSLGYGFNAPSEVPWWYLILMAFLLPHYVLMLKYRSQSNLTSIFNWLLPLSVVTALGAFLEHHGELGYLMYIILFSLFYSMGKLPLFNAHKLRRNGYAILGSVGTIVMLLVMGFNGVWDFEWDPGLLSSHEFFITLVLFGLAFGLLIYLHSRQWLQRSNLFHYVFIFFTLLFFGGMSYGFTATVLVNILVLALGVFTVKAGANRCHFGILNYGLFIITVLIICRFFDTDMSYVVRGILFVGVGMGFFLTNYVLFKKKNSSSEIKKLKG